VAFDQLEGTLTHRICAVEDALMDVIARLEASLDFPDEGYHFITPAETTAALAQLAATLDDLLRESARGRLIRHGLTAVILGRPNTGKSSLFNRLAGVSRAIVTSLPGTTRDLVTERIDLRGVPLTLVDTAGLHAGAADVVEEEGISRARQAGKVADLAIVVLDLSARLTPDDHALLDATAARPRVVVANKRDLPAAWAPEPYDAVSVSALTGDGIDSLRSAMLAAAGGEPPRDTPAIANLRHAALLADARDAVARAREAAAEGAAEEFVLADLHAARTKFDEVTGVRTPDDVLQRIFERFCIGK
jgi:tRNA modification GTPase